MSKYNVQPLRTVKEIEDMKQALTDLGGDRDRLLFLIGINTGLRVSDIVSLRAQDVYGKMFAKVIEHKTGKTRRIQLKNILADITIYCEKKHPDDYLFPSRKGNSHISTTQAYRILVKAGEWIGRHDIGTHTMRKTFGYHVYQRTKDIALLMEIFSHAAPAITKRYIGINEDVIDDALKDFVL